MRTACKAILGKKGVVHSKFNRVAMPNGKGAGLSLGYKSLKFQSDLSALKKREKPIEHIPVLKQEILKIAQEHLKSNARILDATFGGGGHSKMLLSHFPDSTLIALDCDPEAKDRAFNLKKDFGERFNLILKNFTALEPIEGQFDLILFDLGVSSFQLDTAERGFSFQREGDLDMRMNFLEGISAREFLATASREELTTAIRDYGEEPRWRLVVNALLKERGQFQTTLQLGQFLEKLLKRRGRIHPATRVFQGLRIAVNRELEVLTEVLPKALAKLKPGGILLVISFHSLEDRIVKRFFRSTETNNEHFRCLSKKPISSTLEEQLQNCRSRSAKLRTLKRIL